MNGIDRFVEKRQTRQCFKEFKIILKRKKIDVNLKNIMEMIALEYTNGKFGGKVLKNYYYLFNSFMKISFIAFRSFYIQYSLFGRYFITYF